VSNLLKGKAGLAWWPVIASCAVQFDVLGNDFVFDDYLHLYKISNGPFFENVFATHGGHLLQTFNFIIWMMQQIVGANAAIYLLLALGIHLASVRLLFEIIARFTGHSSLAVFGATLWGMCPNAQGSIGWISVNGHVYLTAAILWVVLDVVRFGQDPSRLTRGVLIRDSILLLVAAMSFGIGLAAALVFGGVIALWNPVPAQRVRLVYVFGSVSLAALVIYVGTLLLHDGVAVSRGQVDFIQNNLTHLSGIFRMFGDLLAVGISGLLLGPLLVGEIAIVPDSLVSAVSPGRGQLGPAGV
jgi:hypothetical protein